MNYEVGQIDLSGGGARSFTPNKFSRPPIVLISVVRNSVYNTSPIVVHITQVNKDSFGYTVKNCNGTNYSIRAGDKLNWLAIGV